MPTCNFVNQLNKVYFSPFYKIMIYIHHDYVVAMYILQNHNCVDKNMDKRFVFIYKTVSHKI